MPIKNGPQDSPTGSVSGSENRLDFLLDDGFLGLLGERNFAHQQLLGLVEHLALTERKVLAVAQEEEVAQNFGDFEHGAGLDLLHVLAVAAIPRRLVNLDVALLEDLVNGLTSLGEMISRRPTESALSVGTMIVIWFSTTWRT